MPEEKLTKEHEKILAFPAKTAKERKKIRLDFYVELVLILALGVLVGIAIKGEAIKKITIGYNDYQMKKETGVLSINKLQDQLLNKKSASAKNAGDSGNDSAGAMCSKQ